MQEVVRRGVVDPARVAVGGHSYGAFMAANLLAHAPDLFACGIAKSGAYNRTLTPFGFQSEERTLWQAQEVYSTMSPFNQVCFSFPPPPPPPPGSPLLGGSTLHTHKAM
jgi:dipeptidyl aminopeptidase/acylaminoacyl peptidase